MVVSIDHWLLLGGVALVGNDSLQSPQQGFHQVLQVLVIHLNAPKLGDLPLQLLQAGGLGVQQLSIHQCLHIFNGVQIRAVAWPVNEGDVRPLLEQGFHNLGLVAYSPCHLKQIIAGYPFYTASLTYRRTHRKNPQPSMMTRAAAIIITDAYCRWDI